MAQNDTNLFSHNWDDQNPEIRGGCMAGFFWGHWGRICSMGSGGCWQSRVAMSLGAVFPHSASIFMWPSSLCVWVCVHACVLSLTRTQVTWCRAHPNPVWFHANLTNDICEDFISKSHILRLIVNRNFWKTLFNPVQCQCRNN